MYYFVDNYGQKQGPVSASDLPKYGVTPQTKVWKEGMSAWQPAGSVEEVSAVFASPQSSAPPPPPPATPPPPPPFVPPQSPPVAPPPQSYTLQSSPVEKKGGSLKFVLLGIGGFIALGIVVCVGLYFFKTDFRDALREGLMQFIIKSV